MASNNWRPYGAMNKNEKYNNGYFNTLVADTLTLKSNLNGFLNVTGALTVTKNVTFANTLTVSDNTVLGKGLSVASDAIFNSNVTITKTANLAGNVVISGSLKLYGGFQFTSDIQSAGNLAALSNSVFLGLTQIGNASLTVNNVLPNSNFLGVNTPTDNALLLPGSQLELFNSSTLYPTGLNVYNNQLSECQSILVSSSVNPDRVSSNNIMNSISAQRNGIVMFNDAGSCSINMFAKTHIPFNKISSTDSSYQWIVPETININTGDLYMAFVASNSNNPKNVLTIGGQDKAIIPSTIIAGKNKSNSLFGETFTLYSDEMNTTTRPYLQKIYNLNTSQYQEWNGETIIAPSSNSSTFLNIVNNNNSGFRVGGGLYVNDITRSMGVFGVTSDQNTNWVPSMMIVSGNNAAYCRSTTTINKYSANTENYSLDINGKVCIANAEIVPTIVFPFQVTVLTTLARNKSVLMAVGSPYSSTTTLSTTNYKYAVYYSYDKGLTWLSTITDTVAVEVYSIASSATIYDSSNTFFTLGSSVIASYSGFSNYGKLTVGVYDYSGQYIITSTSSAITNNIVSCKVFDFPNNAVLIVLASRQVQNNNISCIHYAYLASKSNLSNYVSKSTYLNFNTFILDISSVNATDGYDTSYIFVAGSTGLSKHSITTRYCDYFRLDSCNLFPAGSTYQTYDSFVRDLTTRNLVSAETISILPTSVHYNNATYNAMQTYKVYGNNGVLQADPFFSVFVGKNIITTTLDGGSTYIDTFFTNINFNSVSINNERQAIVTDASGHVYKTSDGGITWVTASEFNIYGITNKFFDTNSNTSAICMSSANDILVTNITAFASKDGNNNLNKSSSQLLFCHLPNLFNSRNAVVLDICGSTQTFGSSYTQYDSTIGGNTHLAGSLTVDSGSVILRQYYQDSSNASSGTMIINGGIGIAGSVFMGNSLSVQSSLYVSTITTPQSGQTLNIGSNNGNIFIGSQPTSRSCNIVIGSGSDYVVMNGSFSASGVISTSAKLIRLSTDQPTSSLYSYSGITIGNTTVPNAYIVTDVSNYGFLFKSSFSPTSADLLLDSLKLNSNVNTGLVTIKSLLNSNYKSSNSSYDPSYILTCNPAIDISALVLTNNVNTINNLQTISTDISINGNLTLSNTNGAVRISQQNTSSVDVSSGAIVVIGGIGLSGNVNVGRQLFVRGSIDSSNISSGTLQVVGGMGLTGNAHIGGNLVIDNSTNPVDVYSGALQVCGGVGVQKDVYINSNLYIGQNCYFNYNSNQTLLSTTDFSYNSTFWSTNEAIDIDASSASLNVKGGLKIVKNILVKTGNVKIVSNISSANTASGSLQVIGGVGISENMNVGGNIKSISNIEAVDLSSGSLQVNGGTAVTGNIHVGGNIKIRSNLASSDASSGALQVVGGAGISGNAFIGSILTVLGNNAAYNTNSGALQVKGGTSITGNAFIGGNTVIVGNAIITNVSDAISSYTGSVSTSGGLGVQGNLCVHNQTYFGNASDLINGLILHYPFDVDISNYATGTPISDMIPSLSSSTWTYPLITTNILSLNPSIGYNGALDISSVTSQITQTQIKIFLYSNFSNSLYNTITRLNSFTVSFWVNVRYQPSTSYEVNLFNFFNTNPRPPQSYPNLLYATMSQSGILRIKSDYPNTVQTSNTTLKVDNSWNLITITFTIIVTSSYNLFANLYVNGVYDSNFILTSNTNFLSSFSRLNIGFDDPAQNFSNFHYVMKDFRLYNRVLSQSEINQLYTSTNTINYITNVIYKEDISLNSDATTYTTTPGTKVTYTPLALLPGTTTSIGGNLAVSGFTYLQGNTSIQGDLNLTGSVLINGVRMGYNMTDSSMIIAGPAGYWGGNTSSGNVYLNTLTVGNGGYYGGNTLTGNVSVNTLTVGNGGYFGGNTIAGYIYVNSATLGGSTASFDSSSGTFKVTGGSGIGGNINVGGTVNKFTGNTTSTDISSGTLVITGGMGMSGNVNIGGTINQFTAITNSVDISSGAVKVVGGVGIGGNINVGGTVNKFTGNTPCNSTNTGTVVVTGGVGVSGMIMANDASFVNLTTNGTTNITGSSAGSYITMNAGTFGNIITSKTFKASGDAGASNFFQIDVPSSTVSYSNATVSFTGCTITSFSAATVSSTQLSASSTTDCSLSNTASQYANGAVQVSGGVGIAKSIYIGANAYVVSQTKTNTLNVSGTTDCSLSNTANQYANGAVQVSGGVGIAKSIYIGANAYVVNTLNVQSIVTTGNIDCSTSTYSVGDLQVVGGVGIGKSLYVASNASIGNTVTALSFNAKSDYRIKEGIQDLDMSYNVDNIRPVKYKNKIMQKDDIGFIAHELQNIYPFLVTGKKDDPILQTINYNGIIGILVKEVQNLKKEIQELKARIN